MRVCQVERNEVSKSDPAVVHPKNSFVSQKLFNNGVHLAIHKKDEVHELIHVRRLVVSEFIEFQTHVESSFETDLYLM